MKKQNLAPKSRQFLPWGLILAFSFILYGNTITHDYALDDLLVIKGNAFTLKGFSGIGEIFSYDSFTGFFGKQKKLVAGGRYRPLSIATFAVEYGILGGLHPGFSHLVNILLYALTGIILFEILRKLFRPLDAKSGRSKALLSGLPFVATLIFLAHPLHTEAVANIKGRDEILALLFSLSALLLMIDAAGKREGIKIVLASIFFFLGLLSKENTIMFLAVIPMTLWFFTERPLKKIIFSSLPLLGAALLFILIRTAVLGYVKSGDLPRELLNNPFLNATAGEKFATILYTLGLYLKLLFIPWPLTNDYNPFHIPIISFADPRAWIPFLLYIGLAVVAVLLLPRKSPVSYGILYFFLTLFIVSNLVFPVGTFMNERFLYMPSFGFVMIAGWFVMEKTKSWISQERRQHIIALTVTGVVVVLFSGVTIIRNRAWKDDFTLFTTDVQVSVNSTKCNTSAGGQYFEKAREISDTSVSHPMYRKSEKYLEKALTIYPENKNALLLLGNVEALYRNDYRAAIAKYLQVIALDGFHPDAFKNTLAVLNGMDQESNAAYKTGVLLNLYRANPDYYDVNYLLGKLYGQFRGKPDSAIFLLNRATTIDPSRADAYKDLGILYGMRGQLTESLQALQKAAELDPADQQVRQNLEVTRQMLGTRR